MKTNNPGVEAGLQLYSFQNFGTCDLHKTFLKEVQKTAKTFAETNTGIVR